VNFLAVGCLVVLLSGAWPLVLAWRANRSRTLHQAVGWAWAAWAAWVLVLTREAALGEPAGPLPVYLALCLTGAAGVAVLGARRPGVGAWNFVLLGLLAVLLLPVAEGWGEPRLQLFHLLFLGLTLAVILLNHLPTRLGLAVLLLAVGCGVELARLAGERLEPRWLSAARACVALTPWTGLLGLALRRGRNEFDRVWLAFRDGYGFLWGQRVREQFNRAAANAGRPVVLRWSGLESAAADPAALELLRATLKRFEKDAADADEAGAPGAVG
jgi:hypothetical protein